MLMKKLSEEHYIVMGDSEIKVGDIVAEKLLTGKYELFTIHTLNDIDRQTQKKITHSTQPESLGMGWMQSVQPLFLSEVKELLGEVDVEEKADLWSIDINEVHPADSYIAKKGYMKGYKESLEDNKERKYTEEDVISYLMQSMIQYGIWLENEDDITPGKIVNKMEEIRNKARASLQSKTEWEVEMVEGKLKLKS